MRNDKYRGNVFVANLPKGFTDSQLAEAFDPYGIVISAFLARDAATGEPKRHGLVSIAPPPAAQAAVDALNGKEIGGKRIEVRLADPGMAIAIPSSKSSRPKRAFSPPPRPAADTAKTFVVERRPLRRP
jgi:RNA recognition motif-containing protein